MRHFDSIFPKTNIQKVTIYGSVITLTGTDGTADITINDILNKVSVTFSTDLATTAKNWVIANIEYYEYNGYSVSADSGIITVTPKSDWDTVNRINATISNLTGDLAGTLSGVFEPDFSKANIWNVIFTMDSVIANPRNSKNGDKMDLILVGTGSYNLSWGDSWVSDSFVSAVDTNVIIVKVQYGINLSFANNSGQSWSSYWSHQPEVLFFGLYSDIADGKMPNRVDGGATYLTVAGSAGSETFQAPNTAAYIDADMDYIWFRTDESQRIVTIAELIGYDLQRTPVKFNDDAPNAIVAIMILKSGEVISGTKRDKMFTDMWLPIMWDNLWNDFGHSKSNRSPIEQVLWVPYEDETIALTATFTTPATDGLSIAINNLILGLKDGNYWDNIDCLEKYNLIAIDQTYFNWKTATAIMTIGGTEMDFTTKLGFKDRGSGLGYIKTGFIPSNGVKYEQNSASFIIGRKDQSTLASGSIDGCFDGTNGLLIRVSDGNIARVNSSSTGGATARLLVGYNVLLRRSSTDQRIYNGGWINQSVNSTARPTVEVYLNAYNSGGNSNNKGVSGGFNGVLFGTGFSDADCEAIIALFNNFDLEISLL